MPIRQRNWTVQDYIELFLRRKWWLCLTLFVGGIIATLFSYSLPPTYRSSTMILLERQNVPESYVQATVTSTIQDQLNTISQQVTSRTNLEKIIARFDLYEQRTDTAAQSETANSIMSMISEHIQSLMSLDEAIIQFMGFKKDRFTTLHEEEIINRMRKDIEINVIGKEAFSIAYSGSDPTTVMNVANTLASLFIEENLDGREQKAEGTSQFLESELVEAEKELERQEQFLKDFKARQMGSLPQQLDANLRTLDRLQGDLHSTNEALKNANETLTLVNMGDGKAFYNRQLIVTKSETKLNPLIGQLEKLDEEMARLRAEFNENYPDIIILKKRISDIQRALTEGKQSIEAQRPQSYALTAKAEIESLGQRKKEIAGQIKEYERRVENTFTNEQKLASLTREYEMAQKNYQRLQEKKLNAKISENLEKRQKGEQFKILDPANLPAKPYKPNRPKMILFGSLLSGCLGAGFILFKEYRQPSISNADDVHEIVNVPMLVTIPRHKNAMKTDPELLAIKEPDSIMADQYRVLYMKIEQLRKGKKQTTFAISSSIKGEGKTVTAINLAVVTARDFGRKTLLIEGDLKNPSIARYLKTESKTGLVDILLNKSDVQSTLVTFGHDNLAVLPAGKTTQDPPKLLNSQAMKDLIESLKELYDIIIIDSPPVIPLPDMNILEEVVDGIILLVRAESTPRDALAAAIDSLATQKLVGIVLNDVRRPLAQYYRHDNRRM